MASPGSDRPYNRHDISSAEFWAQPYEVRDETFAWLRANEPVSWHRPMEDSLQPEHDHGEGFWAVTTAADINYVSQNHRLFSSAGNVVTLRPAPPEASGGSNMLGSDPPEHTFYRTMISAFFTPKSVNVLQAKLERRAKEIVSNVVDAGEFDLVPEVSSKLPMLTIADMVGVPESLSETFAKAGNDAILAESDVPEGMTGAELRARSTATLAEISLDVVAHRRTHPEHDIATALAHATRDGEPLSTVDVLATIGLLAVAGNDTTRHTTTWTVWNLWNNPDQKAWLAEDLEGRMAQSVDEFVRHSTVVNFFGRRATQDTEISGVEIPAGEIVGLFYCSGNRDEALYPDPHRFDLQRPRTNHVAFGGHGVHFCLGNVVAKAQLRCLFQEILTQLPNLEMRGEPVRLHNEVFNAVRSLPVST